MKKRFVLYKMGTEINSFLYLEENSLHKRSFTCSSAKAKRFSIFPALWFGLIYNLRWIDAKHTVIN